MRPARRLLPLAILVTALTPFVPGAALADDGFNIKQKPAAPIAGTPLWYAKEAEVPDRPARYPALVIAGSIVAGLGAAGAITGAAFVASGNTADQAVGSTRQKAGMTTLLLSAPIAAAGLTMILVGIQPKPEEAARLVPEVRVGAGYGSLTWRF